MRKKNRNQLSRQAIISLSIKFKFWLFNFEDQNFYDKKKLSFLI